MTTSELEQTLYEFIQPSYPEIEIKVTVDANDIPNIYFTEEKFKELYPKQRYHYIIHKIPEDFFELHLKRSIWFELAPGESPGDLDYHDDETIDAIKTPILSILQNKIPFVSQLDKDFTSGTIHCFGDFRHSKKLLAELGYAGMDEQSDIFHVLMNEGGYCDCEILFNVFTENEYAKQYWSNRR